MSESVRKSRRRTSLLIGALTGLMVIGYGADAVSLLYPDLVSDWGEHDTHDSTYDNARVTAPLEITYKGTELLVVRFDGFVTNIGDGPLRVAGDPQTDSVYQWVLRDDGSPTNPEDFQQGRKVTVVYETDDGHNHWHLKNAQQYALWNEDKTVQVTPGAKVGFCLYDIDQISADAGAKFYGGERVEFCDTGDPESTQIEMGVSVGWKDVYKTSVSQQWVDVSDVAPGVYYLSSETDTSDQIEESDETNNGIAFHPDPVVIPGYLPTDLMVTTQSGVALSIDLPADPHGTPGPAAYSITGAPAEGTASVDPDTGEVSYRPADGFVGTDSFEFTVHDGTSDYPRQRPSATVTVQVTEPAPGPAPAPAPAPGPAPAPAPAPDPSPVFDDVPLDHPYYVEISWLVSQGITNGCGPQAYCPEDPMSREQLASFIVRAFALGPAPSEFAPFTDDDGSPHEDDIAALAYSGITNGCGPTSYCPLEAVSRAEWASFLARALFGPERTSASDAFVDDDGSIHEPAIDVLADEGITGGCGPSTFCPDMPVSRGELAVFLHRILATEDPVS